MLDYLLRLMRPPQFDNADRTQTATQLHYTLIMGVGIAGGIAALILAIDNTYSIWTPAIPAITAGLLAALLFVLRAGHMRMVSAAIIIIGFSGITLSGILNDGIRGSGMFVLPLLLILASVYLGKGATLWLGIGTLVMLFTLFTAEYLGFLETIYSDKPTHSIFILGTGIIFSVFLLRLTVTRIREQAIALQENNQQLWTTQRALQDQATELTRLNDELTAEIAEHERTAAILRQQQKLESIGLLAGGVAHDFNNLLTSIMAQSSLALHKMANDDPNRRHIEKTVASAQRAEDLTRQLLVYAGKANFHVESLDLNKLITQSTGLLDTLIQQRATIRLELSDDLPSIESDRGQIQQVLMNLVMNASEAIHNEANPDATNGTIVIATRPFTISPATESEFVFDRPPTVLSYVCLEVHDNGVGIARGVQERVFDPFFSTKEKGHGLGLSAIMGVVRGLQGGIQLESTQGKGTTFRILLPASVQVTKAHHTARDLPAVTYLGGTVLVIDDEATVRESVTDILATAGFETMTAVSGNHGLNIFRKHMRDIDVVLLDMQMPGIDGEETYHQLCAIDGNVRVIFTSGYSDAEVSKRLPAVHAAEFLPKPYTIDNLISKISTAIADKVIV